VRAYRSDLSQLSTWLTSRGVDLDAATPAHLRSFLAARFGVNDPRSTVRKLSAARTFYAWRVAERAVARNPARLVRSPRQRRPLPGALDESDASAVVEVVREGQPAWRTARDRALCEIAYGAGLRASEVCGLKITDLRPGSREMVVTGKRGKTRTVVFGEPAVKALADWMELRPGIAKPDERLLFVGPSGRGLSTRSLQNIVTARGLAAGVGRRVTPHTLRHSFATHLLDHHADLRVIQELLGHSSLATTQVYTHLATADLLSTYRNAHPDEQRDAVRQKK
jgi:site-specific recombinase XerD